VGDKLVSMSVPQNLAEMLDNWADCSEENIEWCLLCDRPIRCANDMIQDSNTHNCTEGRRLRSISEWSARSFVPVHC
jgi:hypothetical protein